MPSDLRSRKRVAMRQHISDTATRLFADRGFDAVTVDEIAVSADVGRKTVFNYFPRKEDLFFDRDEQIRRILREALRHRGPGVTPMEAYRLLAHQLVEERSLYIECSPRGQAFIEILEKSAVLQARARALRDELAQVVATALSEDAGREHNDPDAYLVASLLLTTWTCARIQAHRTFLRTQDPRAARSAFLSLIEKGTNGMKAAMTGTPYV